MWITRKTVTVGSWENGYSVGGGYGYYGEIYVVREFRNGTLMVVTVGVVVK